MEGDDDDTPGAKSFVLHERFCSMREMWNRM